MLTVTATVVALMLGSEARWARVWLRADPSVVTPVTTPTRDYFGMGAGGFVLALGQLGPYLDLGGEAGYLFASRAARSPLPGPASLIAVGAVVRVHSPRNAPGFVIWGQSSLDYVRTGSLDRASFGIGLGLSYLLGGGTIAFGPRIDYREILALDQEDFPTRDAGLLSFGFSVEFGLFDPELALARPHSAAAAQGVLAVAEDSDHDGVVGEADLCPLEAEDFDTFQDTDGCPELDNDGDGVLDSNDRCPEARGLASGRGCPDQDADETPDRLDKCPAVPGPREASGCPRYPQLVVTERHIELSQDLAFPAGTATLQPRSLPLLDVVARATLDRAPLCLRIQGRGDAVGDPAQNARLAQDRAEAVRAYLVSKGLPEPSLWATGAASTPSPPHSPQPPGRSGRVEFLVMPCGGETP